jgi:hypothetical protein
LKEHKVAFPRVTPQLLAQYPYPAPAALLPVATPLLGATPPPALPWQVGCPACPACPARPTRPVCPACPTNNTYVAPLHLSAAPLHLSAAPYHLSAAPYHL